MTETTEMNPDKRRGRENVERFVTDVYERIRKDHGYRARFRRALSPALAPQIWGDLTAYVDITRSTDRALFTLIGASIALEDAGSPGTFGLGAALRARPSIPNQSRILGWPDFGASCAVDRERTSGKCSDRCLA